MFEDLTDDGDGASAPVTALETPHAPTQPERDPATQRKNNDGPAGASTEGVDEQRAPGTMSLGSLLKTSSTGACPLIFEIRADVLVATVAEPALAVARTRRANASTNQPAAPAATLAHVPRAWLWDLKRSGFDVLYLLGVWKTGDAGLAWSRAKLGPDQSEEAVSSPFAVSSYTAHTAFGGDTALKALKARANAVGLKLMLDFVPNHTAVDHQWTRTCPWLYVQGTTTAVEAQPDRFLRVNVPRGLQSRPVASVGQTPTLGAAEDGTEAVHIAYGHDLHFAWPDTAQLDWRHPGTRAVMADVLVHIAASGLADGVRVDMAMLCLSSVIEAMRGGDEGGAPPLLPGPGPAAVSAPDTSSFAPTPAIMPQGCVSAVHLTEGCFWHVAIAAVRKVYPSFLLVAEAYWGMENALLDCGFDMVYDKTALDLALGNVAATGTSTAPGPAHALTGTVLAAVPTHGLWLGLASVTLSPGATFPFPAPLSSLAAVQRASTMKGAAMPIVFPLSMHPAVSTQQGQHAISGVVAPIPVSTVAGNGVMTTLTTAEGIIAYLRLPPAIHRRCLRFVENHDEPRIVTAACRSGDRQAHALATLLLCTPCARLVHDGQMTGRRAQHSVHIAPSGRPAEAPNVETLAFYRRLLHLLAQPELRHGRWHLAGITPSRDGNESWRHIVAFFITPGQGSAVRLRSTAWTGVGPGAGARGADGFPSGGGAGDEAAQHWRDRSASTSNSQRSHISVQSMSATALTVNSGISGVSGASGGAPTLVPVQGGDGAGTPEVSPFTSQGSPSTGNATHDGSTSVGTGMASSAVAPDFRPLPTGSQPQPAQADGIPGSAATEPKKTYAEAYRDVGGAALDVDVDECIEEECPGRTFLIAVNLSDRVSNGHILFAHPDPSAFSSPEGGASAGHVASLVRGALAQHGVTLAGTGPAPVPLFPVLASAPAGSTGPSTGVQAQPVGSAATPSQSSVPVPQCRRVAFLDWLSCSGQGSGSGPAGGAPSVSGWGSSGGAPGLSEYPCPTLASEGWWVSMDPWRSAAWEVMQMPEG